jgi:hypothetical protein
MYLQNRRNSIKLKGCSPLQLSNGLISLKPAIAYFAILNVSNYLKLIHIKLTKNEKNLL